MALLNAQHFKCYNDSTYGLSQRYGNGDGVHNKSNCDTVQLCSLIARYVTRRAHGCLVLSSSYFRCTVSIALLVQFEKANFVCSGKSLDRLSRPNMEWPRWYMCGVRWRDNYGWNMLVVIMKLTILNLTDCESGFKTAFFWSSCSQVKYEWWLNTNELWWKRSGHSRLWRRKLKMVCVKVIHYKPRDTSRDLNHAIKSNDDGVVNENVKLS